jgi:zinc/manganese transport system substrate-binding protein
MRIFPKYVGPMETNLARRLASAALALALGGMVAAACGSAQEAASPGGVLAGTSIWADVTEQVGCGEVPVQSLVPPGTDAHEYEPSVQDADRLRAAELVVVNGLGIEEGLESAIDESRRRGATVVDAGAVALDAEMPGYARPPAGGDGAAKEPGGHRDEDAHGHDEGDDGHGHGDEDAHGHDKGDDGHGHGDEDPHVWMNPDRVAAVVPAISEALQEVDGLGVTAEQIEDCARRYAEELTTLVSEMEAELSAIEPDDRILVTNHEALGHFAERFGFRIIGTVVPSTSSLAESSPRDLDELVETMGSNGVEVIFAETTGANALAESLTERLGASARVVELYTESLAGDGDGPRSYVEMMRTNAGLVAAALAPPA